MNAKLHFPLGQLSQLIDFEDGEGLNFAAHVWRQAAATAPAGPSSRDLEAVVRYHGKLQLERGCERIIALREGVVIEASKELRNAALEAWFNDDHDNSCLDGITLKIPLPKKSENTDSNFSALPELAPLLLRSFNLYLSWRCSTGLLTHFDTHHVLAFQTQGCKNWRLGDFCPDLWTGSGLPRGSYNMLSPSEFRALPGECLYIPPGLLHCARTVDFSCHYTMGLVEPSYASLVIGSLIDNDVPFPPLILAKGQSGEMEYSIDQDSLKRCQTSAVKCLLSAISAEQDGFIDDWRHDFEKWVFEAISFVRYNIPDCVAIYLRGSAGRIDESKYKPFDIDLFACTQKPSEIARIVSRDFRKWHPNAPRLDLSLFDTQAIEYGHLSAGKRLLAIFDCQLAFGSDVFSSIRDAGVDETLPAQVYKEYSAHIENIWSYINPERSKMSDLATDDVEQFAKAFAKSVFRLAVPLILSRNGQFTREIEHCVDFIRVLKCANHTDIEALLGVLRGDCLLLDQMHACAAAIKMALDTEAAYEFGGI
jgi:hypothetical protein